MQPLPPWAWAYWSGAIALGVIGAGLLLWALFWDRSRGRRRCPGCWYDMSGAPALLPSSAPVSGAPAGAFRCPECGREMKSERRLNGTRRRWRWAGGAFLMLLGACALWITPIAGRVAWWSYAPTSVLILRAPWRGEFASQSDGWLRARLSDGKVWEWQKRWIRDRCMTRLATAREPTDLSQAMDLLRTIGPDAVGAVSAVLPLLTHEDWDVRLAAWVTLARIGVRDENAVRTINDMLMDPASDAIVRQMVVQYLTRNGAASAPAVPALIEVIQRPELHAAQDGFVLGTATLALGRIGPSSSAALPVLRVMADDPTETARRRYAALLSIALITGDVASELRFHVRMLKSPELALRREAITFLHDYDISENGLEAVPALLDAMGDTDTQVHDGAESALRAMLAANPRAGPALARISGGANVLMAERAARVIKAGPLVAGFVGMSVPAPAPPPGAKPAPPAPPDTATPLP